MIIKNKEEQELLKQQAIAKGLTLLSTILDSFTESFASQMGSNLANKITGDSAYGQEASRLKAQRGL